MDARNPYPHHNSSSNSNSTDGADYRQYPKYQQYPEHPVLLSPPPTLLQQQSQQHLPHQLPRPQHLSRPSQHQQQQQQQQQQHQYGQHYTNHEPPPRQLHYGQAYLPSQPSPQHMPYTNQHPQSYHHQPQYPAQRPSPINTQQSWASYQASYIQQGSPPFPNPQDLRNAQIFSPSPSPHQTHLSPPLKTEARPLSHGHYQPSPQVQSRPSPQSLPRPSPQAISRRLPEPRPEIPSPSQPVKLPQPKHTTQPLPKPQPGAQAAPPLSRAPPRAQPSPALGSDPQLQPKSPSHSHSQSSAPLQSQPRPQARPTNIADQAPPPLQTTQNPAAASPKVLQASNSSTVAPQCIDPQQTQLFQQHMSPTAVSIPSKPAVTNELPVDYRLLLVSLADQYISQARSLSASITAKRSQEEIEKYYKLMAAGLGCMESLLKRKADWRMSPREEATVQLRYAMILLQETENYEVAELELTKGIAFCEKHRLLDIKYSMQHTQVRVLFRTKPKAALKALASILEGTIVLGHTAWIYAFRFLRAVLALSTDSTSDRLQALQQLKAISELARGRRDNEISAIAGLLATVTHLRSADPESMAEAQRSIAATRAALYSEEHQPQGHKNSQLECLLVILDLICSLDPYEPPRCREKIQALGKILDETTKDARMVNGLLRVSLRRSAAELLTTETGDIFVLDDRNTSCLAFPWLLDSEVYLFACYASALVEQSGNSKTRKAEGYLKEAFKHADKAESSKVKGSTVSDSLQQSCSRMQWKKQLRAQLLLFQAFTYCERSAWTEALQNIRTIKNLLKSSDFDASHDFQLQAFYLEAVILQAIGELDAALEIYSTTSLAFPEAKLRFDSHVHETLVVLSALNTLLIIRPSTHPSHTLSQALLDRLEVYFTSSPSTTTKTNPHILAAHHLILAAANPPKTLQLSPSLPNSSFSSLSPSLASTSSLPLSSNPSSSSSPSIISFKRHLQSALQHAKPVLNTSIISITLAYMHASFFHGTVGAQAESAANAARTTARDSGSRLWTAVANGLGADTFEREGRREDATRLLHEAERIRVALPTGLGGELQLDVTAL